MSSLALGFSSSSLFDYQSTHVQPSATLCIGWIQDGRPRQLPSPPALVPYDRRAIVAHITHLDITHTTSRPEPAPTHADSRQAVALLGPSHRPGKDHALARHPTAPLIHCRLSPTSPLTANLCLFIGTGMAIVTDHTTCSPMQKEQPLSKAFAPKAPTLIAIPLLVMTRPETAAKWMERGAPFCSCSCPSPAVPHSCSPALPLRRVLV